VIEVSLEIIGLLFLAAFLAGFVDSIAGGGGLITLPAMLIAGIPPLQTLGTNKLGGLFGSGSATLAYGRAGHVDVRHQLPSGLYCGAGAVLGAAAASFVSAEVLRAVLPVLLVAIALYFGLKRGLGDASSRARLSPAIYGMTIVPVIGFYDGILGPGTGSFLMLGFVTLAGYGMLKGTAHTKFLNFSSNIGAFGYFALTGAVLWKIGLVMGLGQFLGAQAGSRLAMKSGARVIRPLLVVVSLVLALKLLADPTNPLRLWAGF
jgi:uncharacterized membrane protein YfcA